MTERKQLRRSEDRWLSYIRAVTKLLGAMGAAFTAGMVGIMALKGALLEVIAAFLKK